MRATIQIATILGLLLMVGCASAPSEYNQGCRDGVTELVENGLGMNPDTNQINRRCDSLDAVHQHKNQPHGKAAQ